MSFKRHYQEGQKKTVRFLQNVRTFYQKRPVVFPKTTARFGKKVRSFLKEAPVDSIHEILAEEVPTGGDLRINAKMAATLP